MSASGHQDTSPLYKPLRFIIAFWTFPFGRLLLWTWPSVCSQPLSLGSTDCLDWSDVPWFQTIKTSETIDEDYPFWYVTYNIKTGTKVGYLEIHHRRLLCFTLCNFVDFEGPDCIGSNVIKTSPQVYKLQQTFHSHS